MSRFVLLLSCFLALVADAEAEELVKPLSAFCERNVTFVGPWTGGDAWLLNYTGPYENDRPPHSQVGIPPPANVVPGLFACLTNLHVVGKSALEWDVSGVHNNRLNEQAHFTCYYGPHAADKLDEFR